jgi:hypothetical protein
MKMTRIAMLSLAVVLYATSALAQQTHGAAGGHMGANMGHSMGHGASASDHGNGGGGSSQKAIDSVLAKNPKIGQKIQSLTGEPASQACAGFKNLGQCVAAAHVSKNLNISFACLSSDMTGQAPAQGTTCPAGTGTKSMSLGKAIQTLSPTADFKAQGKKGETQAQQDLKRSGVKS